MTIQKMTFRTLLLAFACFFIWSCGNTGSADKTGVETATEKVKPQRTGGDISPEERKEYASAYICPMHCKGSGSDAAGKCPVCGMDYVANKNAKGGDAHDGHNHGSHDGHDHSGHDHGSHEGHNH